MSGYIGNLGAANLLKIHKNKNDLAEANSKRADGLIKHAKDWLKILALGLMLMCGTAYASESPSPAPVSMAKTQVSQTNTIRNDVVSPNVGDSIFDWSIAFFIIVLAIFFSIQFFDSKGDDKK